MDMYIAELTKQLKTEGFPYVYEWQDGPGKVYQPHSHKGKVTFYLLEGSLTFDFSGQKRGVRAGERFDVPIGKTHSAIVGPNGASYLVGQEIDGDA